MDFCKFFFDVIGCFHLCNRTPNIKSFGVVAGVLAVSYTHLGNLPCSWRMFRSAFGRQGVRNRQHTLRLASEYMLNGEYVACLLYTSRCV